MASVASGKLGFAAVAAVLEGDVDPGRHGLLLGVVRQALAPEPERRPRDGVHLLELLQRALASTDPNTELDPGQRAQEGGDDAMRELAGRYLTEVGGLEKAALDGVGVPVPVGAPSAGGVLGPVAPSAPGSLRGPGGAGVTAGSLAIGPAPAPARGAVPVPQASVSGWLRPAAPRASGGGKGGLFDPRRGLAELDHGVRKRALVSAAAAARPPADRPPPKRVGVPLPVEPEETPPEGLSASRGSKDRDRDDDDGLRGLVDLELLAGAIPQSERETPYDVEIFAPPPTATPKRESRRERERRRELERERARPREPEIEPDLPDILEEHELPPMPEPDARPEPAAGESMPGRSQPREPFRVPRTPGPHGPPATLMAGVLVALCGVVALAATLGAASARGGLGRLFGGEASTVAVGDGGAGAGDGAEGDAAASVGPCPRGMVEIVAEPEPFCIDRAEYPGIDQPPAVDVDHAHARQACTVRGHALCTMVQWERACRGPSSWQYPYGPRREAGRCRVGDQTAAPGPSGADPHCVTPEGVLDLVGNVAEWTAEGEAMGGSVRSPKGSGCDTQQRLRPQATHPTVGFRCCAPAAEVP
jgi:hypothetical protein